MDSFSSRSFTVLAAVLKANDISAPVQKHLVNVYATLAMTLVVSAIGVAADVAYNLVGFISTLAVFGLLVCLGCIDRNHTSQRLSALYGISFCTGVNLGPLVWIALRINPMLIATALYVVILFR
jgi:FtsH-binding integral membrane protein